ncbi:hypothetical protein SteCoe_35248 [Stentor coeruleus]|uniref:Uncharacterized protein n=1 Tax=Stentor coeruleus TaxID=5963 RepID=A0A1R2ASW9_9CILI|nr:hypothetical protein SteCoe_35248 [Stentor coeruleus]
MYICRIILMVPIYCITSCLSMIHPNWTEILNMIRDIYEAFVIYSFTMLLINYVGGERRLVLTLELKDRIEHPWPFNYFFMSFHPGSSFLRLVKIGVLQFVLVRPLLSALSIGLGIFGLYKDGYFGFDNSYLYIFIFNNISFTLALYGLVLFFVTTEELLEPYHPLPKFLCIKGVIFFSFWQGIALSILEKLGVIKGNNEMSAQAMALMFQNVLVCIEMLVASFAHSLAFSYEEYSEELEKVYEPINKNMANNIKSILSAQDVIKEVKESISPVKYDFELNIDVRMDKN